MLLFFFYKQNTTDSSSQNNSSNFPISTRWKALGWDAVRERFQNYKIMKSGPKTYQNIWSVSFTKGHLSTYLDRVSFTKGDLPYYSVKIDPSCYYCQKFCHSHWVLLQSSTEDKKVNEHSFCPYFLCYHHILCALTTIS